MAVTQYIGARYVPLFVGEWDSTQEYEPLSIVSHQGASYISRQAVPVGVDILNDDFWALTGNYNAQVEAYRQEVRTYDGRITANANAIEDNADAIEAEAAARISADSDLEDAIEAEAAARISADSDLEDAIEAEAAARTNADTELGNRITAEATARTNADTELGNRITATEQQHRGAYERTIIYYIDPTSGNDSTAEKGNINKPFKTLEKAYELASLAGNDLRFTFLKSGIYNLPARLFVGCVIHFTPYTGSSSIPAASGTVQINVVSNDGAVFFYDSHINFAGNENCKIIFNANYQYTRYINNEGSVFWCNWTTFNCSFLQLIQGGTWLNNCDVNGYITGWFANIRIRGLNINNQLDAPALRLSTGILRFEQSSERGFGIYIARNPNVTYPTTNPGTKSAIYLETVRASLTTTMTGANNMGYYRYLEARGSVIMGGDAVLDNMNSYGNQEICAFPSVTLRVRQTIAIGGE